MDHPDDAWRALRNEADWRALMTCWNAALLEDDEIRANQSSEVLSTAWLGYPGATPAQIAEVEARLGVTLPPSYRQFLQGTNGWRDIGPFIDRVWSVEQIDWHRTRHQDLIDAWTEGASYAGGDPLHETIYLPATLEVSDVGDAASLLLNPRIMDAEGEWEAWFFSSWTPGAEVFPSFRDLMMSQYDGYLWLRAARDNCAAWQSRET